MLSNERFKSLVYQKAVEENTRLKKKRTAILRGVAAFSVCFIIGGVFVYSKFGAGVFSPKSESDTDGLMLCDSAYGTNGAKSLYYSESGEEVLDDMELQVAADGAGEAENYTFVRGFSYSEDVKDDSNIVVSAPEPKTYNESHTVLTSEEIVELAKKKCTIEYDTIDAFFDNENRIWKIVFSVSGTAGGCQSVYFDYNGTVMNTVYGE